jgi:putative two-component system response regulator
VLRCCFQSQELDAFGRGGENLISSAKILIVDDDLESRLLLESLLRGEGLSVHAVSNGLDALESVERVQPDLLLLDVLMPDLDGVEVCRRVKTNPETRLIPLLLVTGLSATQDRVRGIEAGADGFLSKPFEPIELLARVRSLLALKAYTDELDRAESVLFTLARTIEERDPYTAGHCERLARRSVELARELGLGPGEIQALERAGIVHDIGKIAVPDSILLKPGPLAPEEWTVMRQHPVTGERICSPLRSLRPVLPIIRHHHERFDGSGYPDGLSGESIPLTARVLQVVDIYDALVTVRPYKRALSSREALETIRRETERGWLDPRVTAAFLRLCARDAPEPS